jgi:hypothetical protein
MVHIAYPPPDFKIKKEGEKEFIFDSIRKKWIVLTPEEWVRQNFIQYLVQVKKYPAALIGVEKEMQLGELKKRFDILVYDNNHQPLLMVECKSMDVALDETVMQQLLRYNISIPVKYLVITNGTSCMAWEKANGQLLELTDIPLQGS